MKFIRTDRGEFVARSAIERVERDAFERTPGRPDDGVRKFNFYSTGDDLLGSVKVREERMQLLLAELMPAHPGQTLITLHYNEDDQSVTDYEHHIIAWAFEPGSSTPRPITTDGDVYSEPYSAVLIRMPDGKFDSPGYAIFDSLETAKLDYLEECKRNHQRQTARPLS